MADDEYPPSHAGVITVYDDSKPGTLNDFLGAMTEDDVRPEALRRFEAMVEEVARQASEASRNATAAGQVPAHHWRRKAVLLPEQQPPEQKMPQNGQKISRT
ncbi:hypothetical protein BBY84_24335 [Salmonella enterica]|nr:hypothetical protein [Salmonella enterica]HEC8153402.1 prophage tail fiber N-terminal domain-containing protein [Salmonella enterica subsp. enterica serovar Mississippi]EBM7136433.1 hypothetical protein [Salmonella enterica]EJU7423455.1 prophage tail fiber N-terminal domain-containing protein [Salmonella enterica]HEC8221268.1 prophage tail fiber N-terminal domain-containing protein [Salmonella enterica subsp. enterica serovar Mississippi]